MNALGGDVNEIDTHRAAPQYCITSLIAPQKFIRYYARSRGTTDADVLIIGAHFNRLVMNVYVNRWAIQPQTNGQTNFGL